MLGKKSPNNKVVIYKGTDFKDIMKNGHKTAINLSQYEQTLTFNADEHILIIASGGND